MEQTGGRRAEGWHPLGERLAARLQLAGTVLIAAAFLEALLLALGSILSAITLASTTSRFRLLEVTPRVTGVYPLVVLLGLAPFLLAGPSGDEQLPTRRRIQILWLALVAGGFFAGCQIMRSLDFNGGSTGSGVILNSGAALWTGRVQAAVWVGDLALSVVLVWLATRAFVELSSQVAGGTAYVEPDGLAVDDEPEVDEPGKVRSATTSAAPTAMPRAVAGVVLGTALAAAVLVALAIAVHGEGTAGPLPTETPFSSAIPAPSPFPSSLPAPSIPVRPSPGLIP